MRTILILTSCALLIMMSIIGSYLADANKEIDMLATKRFELEFKLKALEETKPDISIYCCQRVEINQETVKTEEVKSLVISSQISCKCFEGR